MEDLTLLQRYVRFRDQAAIAQLVEKYHGMVLATCRRRLYSQADAEDATQEVFLAFARDAHKITSSVPGWLHRCAVNVTVSMIRARRSQAQRERQDRHFDGEPCAVGKAIRRETDAVLDDCLHQLDPTDRELLIQNHVMDVPQQALALSMGMTQQAVAKRIGKAMTHLRGKLMRRGVLTPVIALVTLLSRRASRAWASSGFLRAVPSLVTKPLSTVSLVSKVKLGAAAAIALVAVTVTYKCTVRQHDQVRASRTDQVRSAPVVAKAPASRIAQAPSTGRFSNPLQHATSPRLTLAPLASGASASQDSPGTHAPNSASPAQQVASSDRTPSGMTAIYDVPARDDPLADAAETQLHPTVVTGSSAKRPTPSREAQEQDEQAGTDTDTPPDRPFRRIREVRDLEPKLAVARAWKLWPKGTTRDLPSKDLPDRLYPREAQPDIGLETSWDRLPKTFKPGIDAIVERAEGRFDLDSIFHIPAELDAPIALSVQEPGLALVCPEPAQDAANAPATPPQIAAGGGVGAGTTAAYDPMASYLYSQAPGGMISLVPSAPTSAASILDGFGGMAEWLVQPLGLSVGANTRPSDLPYGGPWSPQGCALHTRSKSAYDFQRYSNQELAAAAGMPADGEFPDGPPPPPVEIPEPATGLLLAASAAVVLRPRRRISNPA